MWLYQLFDVMVFDAVLSEVLEITSVLPRPVHTEILPHSLNHSKTFCTVEWGMCKSLPIFLWWTLYLNISIFFSHICWQTRDPVRLCSSKTLSWILLFLKKSIITITITIICWNNLFKTAAFFYFTLLLDLICNVLQAWNTKLDVF